MGRDASRHKRDLKRGKSIAVVVYHYLKPCHWLARTQRDLATRNLGRNLLFLGRRFKHGKREGKGAKGEERTLFKCFGV